MSRIGNKPITVPAEVKVTIDGHKHFFRNEWQYN